MFELIPNEKIQEVIELLNGGLTFRDIKKKTGVSLGTISKIKNGIIEPNRKEENNNFNFLDNDFNKENFKIFKQTNFGKGLLKEFNNKLKKLKTENEKLKEMVNDPMELKTEKAPKRDKSLKELLGEPPKKVETLKMNLFDNVKE